jgi:hypothetical protein
MMTVTPSLLDETTRSTLRSKASKVERLVDAGRSVDERLAADEKLAQRRARRGGWYRKLEDAVLDLTNLLPAGTEDFQARQLFRFLIELKRAIEDDPKTTDAAGQVRLATMRMRDVVLRIGRRLEHATLEDENEAARFVIGELPNLSASDLGGLFGVSDRTVRNWKEGSPVRQNVERVRLVAQLVAYLRHTMTQTGVLMWFHNQADLLAGRSPVQLLAGDLVAAWTPLVSYARGGRAQLDV